MRTFKTPLKSESIIPASIVNLSQRNWPNGNIFCQKNQLNFKPVEIDPLAQESTLVFSAANRSKQADLAVALAGMMMFLDAKQTLSSISKLDRSKIYIFYFLANNISFFFFY